MCSWLSHSVENECASVYNVYVSSLFQMTEIMKKNKLSTLKKAKSNLDLSFSLSHFCIRNDVFHTVNRTEIESELITHINASEMLWKLAVLFSFDANSHSHAH